MYKTYLSGPMHNCSDEEMKVWRDYFKRNLNDCVDPTDTIFKDATPQKIVETDLNDIRNCAFMVCKYDGNKPMVGTSMEMFYAINNNCQVFTIVDDIKKPSPWLIHHSTKVFETKDKDFWDVCDDAIALIKQMKIIYEENYKSQKLKREFLEKLIRES